MLVMWLGPVTTPKGNGDIYGCEMCVAELVHMVDEENKARYTARP